MKSNPVYKREVTVRARSFRMPLIILVFNGILAVVALLNMYSAVAQVRISASVQYSSFLQLYAFVATLEFLLLMFIMPALTSGSISGERERQTLELLFTTRMTPKDIVMGKLFSALSQLMVLIVSSFPILLLTFVYGSMDLMDLAFLMVCFLVTAVFCGGDIMAMGAICAADEMGLRVPQDISLIGYDNVRNARYFSPALTTIHQPKDSLGEAAFNMLLDRIVNKREESQSIEVHPRLVERRSVADGPFVDYRR